MAVFNAKNEYGFLKWANNKEIFEFLMGDSNYKGNYLVTIEKETGKRTLNQNDALHLYCKQLAEALNNAGYTGKKSSTELDKGSEINVIYEHLNRHISEKFGIHIPFPDKTLVPSGNMPDYPTEEVNITAF